MLYPETSPSAPVTRDDIARIIALNQMQFQREPGALDPEGNIIAGQNFASLGSQQPDIFPQPHSPASNPDLQTGFGPFGGRGGEGREGFGEGVADPALGSPTGSPPDPGYSNASVFGRGGDTSDPSSQASQGREAAAMAAAAQGRGGIVTDTNQSAKSDFGHFGQTGLPAGTFATSTSQPTTSGLPSFVGWDAGKNVSDLFDMGKSAVTQGWGAVSPGAPADNSDVIGDMMGQVSGSLADLGAMGGKGGAGTPGTPGGGGGGRGGGAGGGFDTAGAVGSIMGAVTGSMADLQSMGGQPGGGFTGFGATGGYEGSASMSNSGGAQGFGGGAVGGFGGGGSDPGGGGGASSGGGGGAAAGGNDPGGGDPGGGGVG